MTRSLSDYAALAFGADFKPPSFASLEEADAWMEQRLVTGNQLAELAWLMEAMSKTFAWWSAEDGMMVGYSTARIDDPRIKAHGKFAWAVFDPEQAVVLTGGTDQINTGLVRHGVCRLRKQAKAKAYAEFAQRSPKWIKRHDPNGDLLQGGGI